MLHCCITSGILSTAYRGGLALRLLLLICQMSYDDWISFFAPNDHDTIVTISLILVRLFLSCSFLYFRRRHILENPSALWNSECETTVGDKDSEPISPLRTTDMPALLASPLPTFSSESGSSNETSKATFASEDSNATPVPVYLNFSDGEEW